MVNPPSEPSRRFYRTGESLRELTTDFRPFALGRDENGEPDGQIRAFAVSIRNRSDNAIFIREAQDNDPARVDRFESYDIYEPNGVSSIELKGEQGGEEVEIRTIEGHNDFNVVDKIDGFIRSLSHFLSSNKQETTITGAETVINSNITGSEVTFDTAIDSVAGGVTMPTQIQGSDVTLDNNIAGVDTGVSIDTNILTQSDTAEIQTQITDSSVQQRFDIESASVGDLRVADRLADTTVVQLRFKNQAVDSNGNPQILQAYVLQSADFDGYVQNYTVRHYADPAQHDSTNPFPDLSLIGVLPEVDPGSGFEPVVNRDYLSAEQIKRHAEGSREAELIRYDDSFETVYRLEPNQKLEFQEGDDLRFLVGLWDMQDDFSGDTTYSPGGYTTSDRWITEISMTIGQREISGTQA